MKHSTDQLVGLASGFSLSTIYLISNKFFMSVYTMTLIDFGYTCLRTALVGIIGGFCGILGKELYTYLKNKFNK